MELNHDYLSRQLIAYIGNKRALLPFLAGVFAELSGGREETSFLDPFCGSGSVSRLGKYLGFRVIANDWEPYARIVTECHLSIDHKEVSNLFPARGGVEAVFEELNKEGADNREPGYIAIHYAPKNTGRADYRYERLFYTRENALFIDRVRDLIEERYRETGNERTILLSSLLYQAATHANTSGVFKAYHKGFGGHGKDALKRIMQPMQLKIPCLIDGRSRCEVHSLDAEAFVTGRGAHICYLDPPYNSHQYGSNYFMLNTIALWDKPAVSMERAEKNGLKEKGGIRKDWVKTRSPFCSRQTAGTSFARLLDRIDARYICLSYNTEGIIPFEELCDMMAEQGKLTLQSKDYVKYRGGKQSIVRNTHNIEFLLVLDRHSRTTHHDQRRAAQFFLIKRIHSLLKRSFVPERISENFESLDGNITLHRGADGVITAPMIEHFRFDAVPGQDLMGKVDLESLKILEQKLNNCQCRDRQEECTVLMEILKKDLPPSRRKVLQKLLLQAVKKFSHKKYRKEFTLVLDQLFHLISSDPEHFGAMKGNLEETGRIAALRFSG